MARVQVHADDVELDSPVLVEGLPGTGLVGKITADNLVEQFDMSLYGSLYCEGLPDVAVYHVGYRLADDAFPDNPLKRRATMAYLTALALFVAPLVGLVTFALFPRPHDDGLPPSPAA